MLMFRDLIAVNFWNHIVVPGLNSAPRHEDVCGNQGTFWRILNFCTSWKWIVNFTPQPLHPWHPFGRRASINVPRTYLGIKGGQRVRLTTSPPSVSRLSRENVGGSTSHNPVGLHGLLQGQLYLSYNCLQMWSWGVTEKTQNEIDNQDSESSLP
jgi:hypothetical protein